MKFNALLVSAAMMVMTLAACGDDDPVNPDNNQGGNEDTETVEGDVEGTWKANSIILVSGHITVPAGKSLTIEEGVQVIFDDKGVGANHVPVEFTVDGNLYCKGTAENPVLFSVAEENRTKENTFAGLWGGIVASNSCEEMLIDHTVIEYTGGQVWKVLRLRPMVYIRPVTTLIRRSRLTISRGNMSSLILFFVMAGLTVFI